MMDWRLFNSVVFRVKKFSFLNIDHLALYWYQYKAINNALFIDTTITNLCLNCNKANLKKCITELTFFHYDTKRINSREDLNPLCTDGSTVRWRERGSRSFCVSCKKRKAKKGGSRSLTVLLWLSVWYNKVKVSWFQKEFLVSSISRKMNKKIQFY